MGHPGQRRYQLSQRLQQVNPGPQLLFGCERSPGEERRNLFQPSDLGHAV